MKSSIGGIIPAMLTPFTRGGKHVDYDKAAALAERLVKQRVDGIFTAGTTGEGLLLDLDERMKLLEVVSNAVGKKVHVIPHIGCLSTRETVILLEHAKQIGAPAAGVVAPGFFKYDHAALKRFYTDLARAAEGFHLLLYNLPQNAGNELSPKLVIELASEVENIVGIKDSGGNMPNLNAMLAGVPKGFRVINGCDPYTMQALITGAVGSVASNANLVPEVFRAILEAVQHGDIKKAWKSQQQLCAVADSFPYGGMIAPIKEALRLRGFDAGYVRPPQREMTAAEKRVLANRLESIGAI